eukprot:365788-Chlamydomonas_euryale.AAC.9
MPVNCSGALTPPDSSRPPPLHFLTPTCHGGTHAPHATLLPGASCSRAAQVSGCWSPSTFSHLASLSNTTCAASSSRPCACRDAARLLLNDIAVWESALMLCRCRLSERRSSFSCALYLCLAYSSEDMLPTDAICVAGVASVWVRQAQGCDPGVQRSGLQAPRWTLH